MREHVSRNCLASSLPLAQDAGPGVISRTQSDAVMWHSTGPWQGHDDVWWAGDRWSGNTWDDCDWSENLWAEGTGCRDWSYGDWGDIDRDWSWCSERDCWVQGTASAGIEMAKPPAPSVDQPACSSTAHSSGDTVIIPMPKRSPIAHQKVNATETGVSLVSLNGHIVHVAKAALPRDPRALHIAEQKAAVCEIAAMEDEDALSWGFRLAEVFGAAETEAGFCPEVTETPPSRPPGLMPQGCGACSTSQPLLQMKAKPKGIIPGPCPPSHPPPPGLMAQAPKGPAPKSCKFIPAPGDFAGEQLRKLKDKHNERESRRRARRAREAEAAASAAMSAQPSQPMQ